MIKSGFVSIIGRPNVGKSTLLNAIIGQKIAIMSNKPQTTRHTIRGVYNDDESQIVFLDTPGIHKARHALGEYMVKEAKRSLEEVELVLFMVDETAQIGPGDRYILTLLSAIDTAVIVVINKIDLIKPDQFKALYEQYQTFEAVDQVIGISAIAASNLTALIKLIKQYLPEGPRYYSEEDFTDQAERQIVAEIIREKLLMFLRDEIPHGVNVTVESFKRRPDKPIIDIEATIVCERESHKGIIIGKAGRKLKGIGKASRQDIEEMLASKVNLQLWVKVRPGWRNDQTKLREFGYD